MFIENHECLSFLQAKGRGIHAALKGLNGEVMGLRGDRKGFEEGAQGIVADLKRNRQTLQHHLQVRFWGRSQITLIGSDRIEWSRVEKDGWCMRVPISFFHGP